MVMIEVREPTTGNAGSFRVIARDGTGAVMLTTIGTERVVWAALAEFVQSARDAEERSSGRNDQRRH